MEANEVIAVLENPAKTKDVLELKHLLHSFIWTDSNICDASFLKGGLLGDIQSSYNTFVKTITEYRDFLRIDLYAQKEEAARRELQEYGNYIAHLKKQAELNKEELQIAETTHQREKTLFKRNVTSQADYEQARQTYPTHRQGMELMMTSLSSARMQQAQLEQNIVEIRMQRAKDKNNLQTALRAAFDELGVSIENWELTYLFITPSAGILSYN